MTKRLVVRVSDHLHSIGYKDALAEEKNVRIAQVAPLYESVPPKQYGGTERIVSYLTEGLVCRGHDVTLFASGDSQTSAELVSTCRQALRISRANEPLAHHLLMLEEVFRREADFDVVHFHVDYFHFPITRRQSVVPLTTLHGRLDSKELEPLYREYREMPLISISQAQRAPLRWANWIANVYHGLPKDLYKPHLSPGKYLAFLGRISKEKGLDRAIEIAHRSGIPLKIAAKIDPNDMDYFQGVIKPLLNSPLVEFLGEIEEQDKNEFLGNALALVFPIDWPEPFGIVLIEAMSCGTPIIAFRRGSVPEIVEDGISGYVVQSVEEAVSAVGQIAQIDRRVCRQTFEARFLDSRMINEYLGVYAAVVPRQVPSHGAIGEVEL